MLIEAFIKDQKILQHEILLDADLFHAHFLKETPPEALEDLLKLPLHFAKQNHTDLIHEAPYDQVTDGLFTVKSLTPLVIRHADCQAAIFWDPLQKILALVHAGWRGQVQEIYSKTVNIFKKKGSDPKNILVGISPSLGLCHAEFKGWKDYFPEHFKAFEVKENYFDLKEAARSELLKVGLLPHHLSISQECTAANPDKYHSWRQTKTKNRLATLAYRY